MHKALWSAKSQAGTNNRYLILASDNPSRNALVKGWSATMAEQMESPSEPSISFTPWWDSYARTKGVSIEPRGDRHGDVHIQDTLFRGLTEELGLEKGIHYSDDPPLLNVCLEEHIYFITFIFFVQVNLSIEELYRRWRNAPDHQEAGVLAAYQISGNDNREKKINGPEAIAKLLGEDTFNGGPYLIKNPVANLVRPWHISSRMRIYALAYHLWNKEINTHITIE